MKTICIEAKKYEEWDDEDVRGRILEKHWDINVDYEWWEFVDDDAKEIGKLMGINIDKVYFSGFSSQGDGACFEGNYRYEKESVKKVKAYAPKDTDLHEIAERLQSLQKPHFYALSASVKHRGHYYHEMCTEIDVYKNDGYLPDDGTEEELIDTLRDYMRWIYRRLEKEYDYLTSEEAIIETFKANEYEFADDGSIM
jgi:hypothetical protein